MLLWHCWYIILIYQNTAVFVSKYDILPIFPLPDVIANMRITRFIVSRSFPAIKRNTHVPQDAADKI